MIRFKVKNISGGLDRGFFIAEATDLSALATTLEVKVINSCPGWAFLMGATTGSYEVTWSLAKQAAWDNN